MKSARFQTASSSNKSNFTGTYKRKSGRFKNEKTQIL
jgi:hypothetical protein